MKVQLAREYMETIDKIQYGRYSDKDELHYLEGLRALLHIQLKEIQGSSVPIAEARCISLGK